MARTKRRTQDAPAPESIETVDISGVMRSSYRDYAAAVVVGRAIADVRDGLKPVHRRILYAMKVGGYDWTAGYRKSARIVGDTMGVFHPHGDSAIYDAMARLTQTWSVTAPLVDGQGNFGSPDGDGPAAMRYTEARLAPVARFLLEEISRDTVDFQPNYDETTQEPAVLPAAFPNALVNGGAGIAVGLASSVPPHNLGEVVAATLHRLANPGCPLDTLLALCPGPDFPTGGRILGTEGVRKAYETGRGSVVVEATTHIEGDRKGPLLVYADMPWGKTRPDLLARINTMISEGQVPDIVSARDETDRHGPRFVVELRAGADAKAVDRLLKTQTDLRTSISLNLTLLDRHGVPREMSLADILDEWIAFRRTTIRRRATHDLAKARDRGRLLLGRMAALSIIDKVVKTIRQSATRDEALSALCALSFARDDFGDLVALLGTEAQRKGKRFRLTQGQAEDIMAMRLGRLTGMERAQLEQEARDLVARMHELRAILADPAQLDAVLAGELREIADAHGQPRRTVIDATATVETARAATPAAPRVTGHVFRTADGRLGRTRKDAPEEACATWAASTHARVVAFTAAGTAYGLDVAALPAVEDKADPRALPGLLGQSPDGEVAALAVLEPEDIDEGGAVLTFVSADGAVRRTRAAEFARIPAPGKMAMKIGPQDPPIVAAFVERESDGAVLLATASGLVARFALADVRVMAGRTSRGVRGVKLAADDRVVSACEMPASSLDADACAALEHVWLGKASRTPLDAALVEMLDGDSVVQVTASGHLRQTLGAVYRQTRRDTRGINDRGPAKTIGPVLGAVRLGAGDLLAVETTHGEVLRLGADAIRRGGRATTGGRLDTELQAILGVIRGA